MDTLAQLLQEHFDNYPNMEIQDAVKFLYQSHMGPGHLIADESAAMTRLNAEWDSTPDIPRSRPYESIGNGLCRFYISCCKGIGLSPKTLHSLFCLTANTWVSDPASLENSLELLYALPFPKEEIDRYLTQYRADGYPMVSHSDRYRQLYSPAYRIVRQEYAKLLPILCSVDALMAETDCVRLAIDGPCASGKSTLGRLLAQIYHCPLFSMDDFFLRPEQRTRNRLTEPGGNVDYERFDREVLSPLCKQEPVIYRRWDCHLQEFAPARKIEPAPLVIVEGSYALRPDFRDRYHLRIWAEAPWEIRRQRLLNRDGPEMMKHFQSLWIPMEDRYFSTCQVKECCHFVWDGSGK